MTTFYFVEAIDSLFVRGNLAFGDAGEHGAGVIPPPPSLFAGAFRSAILGRDAAALAQFTQSGRCDDPRMVVTLGCADRPGAFRIAWLTLAGVGCAVRAERPGDGAHGTPHPTAKPEAVFPLPADLVRLDQTYAQLTPEAPNPLVADGRELPRVAVLRTGKQTKPEGGFYLRESGWLSHLSGELPDRDSGGVRTARLHARDPRLGIGLNADARTAESGLIYTTEGHAFSPKDSPFTATGFLVGIDGADVLLPDTGFLRLGGDGRGARYRRIAYRPPMPPLETIARTRRFRIILTTPGLFTEGWLPTGVSRAGGDYLPRAAGCTARLVCAAIPRREVISGWDLFKWQPKDALRAVPAGSVYWFEAFEGDPGKLAGWAHSGLWGDNANQQRRAEGYNLASLAAWT